MKQKESWKREKLKIMKIIKEIKIIKPSFCPQNWLIVPKCHTTSNKLITSINSPSL
jgi:hypothetical protein